MRFCWTSIVLFASFSLAQSHGVDPRVKLVSFSQPDLETKRLIVESTNGAYELMCKIKAPGCITPSPHRYYRLVTEASTEKPDIGWIKEWYGDYTKSDTVGLVPAWTGWDRDKKFMDEYKLVGAYALVRFTAKVR